jgi:hypothetical protein
VSAELRVRTPGGLAGYQTVGTVGKKKLPFWRQLNRKVRYHMAHTCNNFVGFTNEGRSTFIGTEY